MCKYKEVRIYGFRDKHFACPYPGYHQLSLSTVRPLLPPRQGFRHGNAAGCVSSCQVFQWQGASVCHRNSSVTKEVIMLEVKVRQPKCTFCPYHHRHAEACGTKLKGVYLRPFSRYCTGGKRPRVFKPKDPKEKVPAWCPRRITPCAVRVYHYKNPDTELLQSLLRQRSSDFLP